MNIDDPIVSIFSVLFLAVVIHGLFLSFLIIKSEQRRIKYLLGSIILLVSLWILNYLFYTTGWIIQWPHLLDICIPWLYLIGPLFWFLTRSLVQKGLHLRITDTLHFLPFLYILSVSIPEYMMSGTEKLDIVNHIYDKSKPTITAMLWGNMLNIWTLIYAIASFVFIQGKKTTHTFKTAYERVLIWLSLIFILIILGPIVLMVLNINGAYLELFMVFLLAVIIHASAYLFFKSNKELKIFGNFPVSINQGKKYQTSPLDEKEIKSYLNRLEQLFTHKKPWKDPGYSIDNLAEQLNIPKHHLSQVINEGMGMNFYDLVNKYRVDEVIIRLKNGDHASYSISGIGSDCGFNSTSTFHRAFRKMTGTSPSSYLKKIKSSS